MKYLILILNVLSFWLMADVAHAEPITLAIAAIGEFLGSISFGKLILTVALNIGLSLIEKAMAKKDQQPAGTKLEISMGDDHPMSFIIGSYATAGRRKYAGTWGEDGKTPNAYFTDVIEIGSLPNRGGERGLSSLWIDDRKVGVLWEEPHPDGRGFPVIEYRVKGKDYLWVKFLDGTQGAPDPFLLAKFGGLGDRPWRQSMVGRGCQIAILTSRYNRDLFSGVPSGLFEPHPLPLYDIRKDSSMGGNGPHRWNDRSTWERSTNPAVMIYNLVRGIYYGPEWVYGGQNIGAFCLPAANWMAAANACDAAVPIGGGVNEAAYRAGYDVQCDREPLDVISELLKGCNGRMAEVGGVFKMLVGAPGGAVYSFTDDDIVVTEGQNFEPFPSLSATYNAIEATYPEPAEKWATKDAPGRYNADLEAQDGYRRLPAQVQLLAVPFANQVQRVGVAMIQDYRRFRVHQISLPPDAYPLEPNDVVSWSSARNGYDEKKFLVVKVEPQPNFLIVVTLKEIDPADYDWHPGMQLPTSIGWLGPITPPSQSMIGWTVEPSTIKDAGGIDRRPAIKISCAPDLDDVAGVWVQVRVKASGDMVFDSDSNPYAAPYSWVLSGQWTLPNVDYEARGRYLPQSNRPTEWSAWLTVKTPNVLIQAADIFDGAIIQSKIADAAVTAAKIMDEAVTNLKLADKAVSTAKIEVAAVTADVLASNAVIASKLADGAVTARALAQGAVDATALASGIKAVEVVNALPTTGNTEGRQVFLTTDGKLYRYHDGAWTAAVAADDVNGTLNSAQIADNAITGNKLAALAVDASKLADGTIVPSKIADGAITNSKLEALAIDATKLADSAITVTKIADGAISTPKLQANAITADKIAANNITAKHLVLADTSNIADNGWQAGNLEGWEFSGLYAYAYSNGEGDASGWYARSTAQWAQFLSRMIAVNPGEQYFLDVWVQNNASAEGASIWLFCYDANNANVFNVYVDGVASIQNKWVRLSGQATVPAGVVKIRMGLYNVHAGLLSAPGIAWSKPVMRRASGAELIVDGAITAAKVAANAITAEKIAAGAVSANTLAVGMGANWLQNSDTSAGLTGWACDKSGGSIVYFTRRTDGYAPPGGAFEVQVTASADTTTYADMTPRDPTTGGPHRYAVAAGKWYEFSAYYYGLSTKGATFYVGWLNSAGDVVAFTANNAFWLPPQNGYPNNDLASYQHVFTSAQAPAGAVKAIPFVRNEGVAGGQSTGYVWVTRLFFGEATQHQTEPSPWSPAGITVVNGGNIITGAITADKIAANAVTADKMAANSVTAGTIAAGAVSAAQIAAGAVTADKIAAGSVSADKLAVGSGKNLIVNSDWSAGLANWGFDWSSDYDSFVLSMRYDGYAPNGGTVQIYQKNGNDAEFGIGTANADGSRRFVNVIGGRWYELSGLYYGHRCKGVMAYVQWLTGDGTHILFDAVYSPTDASQNGYPNYSAGAYQQYFGVRQAPANAARAYIFFRMRGTIAGQSDSYFWLYQVYFGEGVANQSAPSKWSDGFSTLISGGNIVTGSVTTDKIATNAVTAGKIAAGAVTAGTIAAGAVTAATVAAGAITGDKIAANTIGANQIAAGAITAKSLILTDFSNMADNGWQGGNLDGWEFYGLYAYAYSAGEGDASGYYARSTSGWGQFYSRPITVNPGEKYAFDVWAQNNTAPAAQVFMFCYDANGNNISNQYVAGTAIQNAWVRLQGQATVPANVVKIRMCLYTNTGAALAAPGIAWSKPVMRRATSAELIVDGAITANKIAANSITADKLAAGAITADKIATGSISTDKLVIGGIDATRIAQGTVSRCFSIGWDTGAAGAWTTVADWWIDNGNPSAVVHNFRVNLLVSGGPPNGGGNTGSIRCFNVTLNNVIWQWDHFVPGGQQLWGGQAYLVQTEPPPAAATYYHYVVQIYSVVRASGSNILTWNYR